MSTCHDKTLLMTCWQMILLVDKSSWLIKCIWYCHYHIIDLWGGLCQNMCWYCVHVTRNDISTIPMWDRVLNWENLMFKDLSMMYHPLWDRRHEGAMRISQSMKRVASSTLMYLSGPWAPLISQRYTVLESDYDMNYLVLIQCMKWPVAHSPNSTWFWLELVGNCCERLNIIMECTNIQFCERLGHGWQFHPLFDILCSRNLQAKFQSRRWRIMHCRKSMHGFVGHVYSHAFVKS